MTHRHAYLVRTARSKLKGKDAASAVVAIVVATTTAAARYVFTLAKSKWLQMCHVKIVIKFSPKIRNTPWKTQGKQSNRRNGKTDRDGTERNGTGRDEGRGTRVQR